MLRRLRHPFIVEFKGVGAMHNDSAAAMRRSMFLVQVGRRLTPQQLCNCVGVHAAGRLCAAVLLRALTGRLIVATDSASSIMFAVWWQSEAGSCRCRW